MNPPEEITPQYAERLVALLGMMGDLGRDRLAFLVGHMAAKDVDLAIEAFGALMGTELPLEDSLAGCLLTCHAGHTVIRVCGRTHQAGNKFPHHSGGSSRVAAVVGHTRVGWCVGQAIFRVLASRRDFRSPAPVGSWCAGLEPRTRSE
jgi:hypothetical protein